MRIIESLKTQYEVVIIFQFILLIPIKKLFTRKIDFNDLKWILVFEINMLCIIDNKKLFVKINILNKNLKLEILESYFTLL